jgi:hypothetical protein
MYDLYLKKYLKYKLKYNKIKGGGYICNSDFKTFLNEIKKSIIHYDESLIIKYHDFMQQCEQSSDYETAYKKLKETIIRDEYLFRIIKYYNFMLKCKQSTFFYCEENFCANNQLEKLETAAISAYNSVFKTSKFPNSVYLRAKNPTYNFDEIDLLINLNNINDKHPENIFTPFRKIIFDTYKLEYYLEFKLYTSDLYTYLRKICHELDGDKLIKLLEFINKILYDKLQILLGIDYLTCLDIKLTNILISYGDNFDINEIVLHDFDMIACCTRKKETTSGDEICNKSGDTNKYLLIYYKLILFFQSYKIIKHLPGRFVRLEVMKSLFQDELSSISIEDLKGFFLFFINENNYELTENYNIANLSIATLSIKEKMHFFFHHYLLNFIIKSNPDILRRESRIVLFERIGSMIPNIVKRNPIKKEYVPLLPDIFKGIFDGKLIL